MLVMSGIYCKGLALDACEFQSRNREACHVRLAGHAEFPNASSSVSISQSRCLSFQDGGGDVALEHVADCFNLAIEMLVISGPRGY